ncbi:ABC transporter permease, partial [Mesorhizobium sp. M2A.F.Ca.ET.039.01.1.1]
MTLISAPVQAAPIGRLRLSDIPRLAKRNPLVFAGGGLLALLIILA